jgi:hypothetical protein
MIVSLAFFLSESLWLNALFVGICVTTHVGTEPLCQKAKVLRGDCANSEHRLAKSKPRIEYRIMRFTLQAFVKMLNFILLNILE